MSIELSSAATKVSEAWSRLCVARATEQVSLTLDPNRRAQLSALEREFSESMVALNKLLEHPTPPPQEEATADRIKRENGWRSGTDSEPQEEARLTQAQGEAIKWEYKAIKWKYLDHPNDEIAETTIGDLKATVHQCDGDFTFWTIQRLGEPFCLQSENISYDGKNDDFDIAMQQCESQLRKMLAAAPRAGE